MPRCQGFPTNRWHRYEEIFAPVARLDSLKLLLALAARFDLEVHQIDIKSAYLNGNVDEELYTDQPEDKIGQNREKSRTFNPF
jgi:Reverse transcriptase (RNA-dependent DNA polymerase)